MLGYETGSRESETGYKLQGGEIMLGKKRQKLLLLLLLLQELNGSWYDSL